MDNRITLKGHVNGVTRTSRVYNAFGVPSYNEYEVQLQVEGRIITFDLRKVSLPKGSLDDVTPVTVTLTFPEGWEVS